MARGLWVADAYSSTPEGPSTAGLRTRKQAENEIGRIMRSVNKTIEEAAAGGCPPPPPPSGGLNDDDEEYVLIPCHCQYR